MHGLTGEKVSSAPPCLLLRSYHERLRLHDSSGFKTFEPGDCLTLGRYAAQSKEYQACRPWLKSQRVAHCRVKRDLPRE
jgi:hypothetical protein